MLAQQRPLASFAVLAFAIITITGIYVGQTQRSFQITLEVHFQKYNILSLLGPLLSKPITAPDIHQNLHVPALGAVQVNATHITCHQFAAREAILEPQGDKLAIILHDITLSCDGDWSLNITLSQKGSFTLTIVSANVSAVIDVHGAGSSHMDFDLANCGAQVKTDVDFRGSVVAKVANQLKDRYILGPLNEKLSSFVCDTVYTLMKRKGNLSHGLLHYTAPPPAAAVTTTTDPLPLRLPALGKIQELGINPNGTLFQVFQTYSVWEGVYKLWEIKEYTLALLIGILSGVWPYVKNILVLLLWFSPYCCCMSVRTIHRILMFIELIGKWSMVDVFFVAVLTYALRLTLDTVVAGELVVKYSTGAFTYSISVVLSLIFTAVVTNVCYRDLTKKMQKMCQGSDADGAEQMSVIPTDLTGEDAESIQDEEVGLVIRTGGGTLPAQHKHILKQQQAQRTSLRSSNSSANNQHWTTKNGMIQTTGGAIYSTNRVDDPELRNLRGEDGVNETGVWFLGLLVVSVITIGLFGIFLPSYYLTKSINVNVLNRQLGPHEEFLNSLVSTTTRLSEVTTSGFDYILIVLLLIFVVVVPLVKFLLIIMCFVTSRLVEFKNWKQWIGHIVIDSMPWDMRDVFIVTILVLSIRITQMITILSKRFADITVQTEDQPGMWACCVALVLEYVLFFICRHYVK